MKAYKGFDKDLKCRDFQYEIGKTYTHNGDVEPCESGFHACEYPLDVFNYYPPAGSRFAEVETSGKIVPQGDKICCEKIKVKTELTLGALIQAAVNFSFERAKWTEDSQTKKEKGAASATGYCGAASATGDRSAASATGKYGAASATGDYSAASATGDESIACGLGVQCKAKGAKGCWLVLAERNLGGEILSVKAEKVDGEKIKENTYYQLVNGEFVEAEK